MKTSKLLASSFIAMSLLLSGCGGSDDSSESSKSVDTEEPVSTNPLMDCEVKVTDVKSGSGNVIGTRAYVEISQSDFESLSDEQIAEFVLSEVKDKDYNYFTIDFGNGKGVVFPGCSTFWANIGDIDETGGIEHSERHITVNDDGTVEYEDAE